MTPPIEAAAAALPALATPTPRRGLFLTGTDTGVGKTRVATAIVRLLREQGRRVGAYKPAASGSVLGAQGRTWDDVEALHDALAGGFPRDRICPQRFHAAAAPPVAARLEGAAVDSELLLRGAAWWSEHADILIVEGAGGLLSPLSDELTVADLADALGYPLLVVARASLGTINHTLLTLEAARTRQLRVAGVLLNHATPPDAGDASAVTNRAEVEKRCDVPILAELPFVEGADLRQVAVFRRIDFAGLAGEALPGKASASTPEMSRKSCP